MAFRGQIGAGLPPVSDLLDFGDISSVSLPYLMSKEPVMRLELMLTKLSGRLLRAVHWPCLDAHMHLMVPEVDRKKLCWVLNHSCQPLPTKGKTETIRGSQALVWSGWLHGAQSHPWESLGPGLPGSHGGAASCPRFGSAGSQVD